MAPKKKDTIFEVKQILDKKKVGGETEYFVSWVGYGPSENSWEPADNLNCPELLEEYEKKHSGRLAQKRQTPASTPMKSTPAKKEATSTKKVATPTKKATPLKKPGTPAITPAKALAKTPAKTPSKTSAKKTATEFSSSSSTRRSTKRVHEILEEDEPEETPRKAAKKIPKDTIALLHEQKKATPGKSIISNVQRTYETQDDEEDDEEEEQTAPGGSSCVIL